LLLGSKLNHALRRAGHSGVDLNVMLVDEAYARRALATCRTYGDEAVDLLVDQYIQLSLAEGAWKNGAAAPAPLTAHEEAVPASLEDYVLTSGPRASGDQPVPASSRPGEDGTKLPVKRGFLAGFASARSGAGPTPSPDAAPPTPDAEQLKKYIRGAR
jgi:hypothetical protein